MSKLETIHILDSEIKKLKSTRGAIEGEIEQLQKEKDKLRKNSEKEVSQIITEAEDRAKSIMVNVNKIYANSESKLKTIAKREEDSLVIQEQFENLKKEKKELDTLIKLNKEIKISMLEKTRLAELRSEQLAVLIGEKGKKPVEVEKKTKKKK